MWLAHHIHHVTLLHTSYLLVLLFGLTRICWPIATCNNKFANIQKNKLLLCTTLIIVTALDNLEYYGGIDGCVERQLALFDGQREGERLAVLQREQELMHTRYLRAAFTSQLVCSLCTTFRIAGVLAIMSDARPISNCEKKVGKSISNKWGCAFLNRHSSRHTSP